MDIVANRKIADAEDLLEFLEQIKALGFDLSTVYVLDRAGDDATEINLVRTRLTDGSTVSDLRICFD